MNADMRIIPSVYLQEICNSQLDGMRIKKGDTVKILAGKDRGKSGKISRVFPDGGRAVVEGLNLFKKRSRPKKRGQKGETVLIPRPIHLSKLALMCSACQKAVRVGFRTEGNKKVRYCKKCGAAA